ncbi:type I secretion system permease/ATPase [Sphingomonas sp. MMS24-J13]|uniref:type I secretion system permease/ATPase n=1 Tax=Sphingomonas sp. MMS24-J13 TaxID=3238686 RepID=UPI00385086CB
MASAPEVAGRNGAQWPIARLLREYRHSFYLILIFTFITEALAVAPIIYMMSIYDRAMGTRSLVTLASLTLLILGVYLFGVAIEWMRTRLMVRISLRVDWDLAADVFDASFRRSVGRRKVNIQQLMGDLLALRQFLTGGSAMSLLAAPFAIIFVIVGALFHPYLAVFIFVAVMLMMISAYVSQKVSSPVLKRANDESSESMRIAATSLDQAETTLALGMMPAVRKRWYERHRVFLQLSVNASEASGLVGGFSSFLSKALPSLQIALGCYLAIEGLITGGMVIAASMLISRAVQPIQRLLGNWSSIVSARQAYERLNLLLIEDRRFTDRMALPAPLGRLDVAAAAAIPPGAQRPVVGDISFAVRPGEAVAIIGPSGSGKTSLTRMLVGVWKPALGSVRLDGVELSEWNHDEVGPYIGYVPQEVVFPEGTVAENIARLGNIDAEKVVEAAQLIGMHETILAFPEGYETRLGGSGFQLSGGQRQRLGIARAFYGNPRYVVMDEPNASLDEVGETALMRAIVTMKERGTSFVLTTHRPRLMSVADNMLVLRQGRQVGFGSAVEMISAIRHLQIAAGEGAAPDRAPSKPASTGSATAGS